MPIVDILVSVLLFVWAMLKAWLYIFAVPFMHLDTLWIMVPIWLNWFFAEFFQEKKGTSFGNAISNGVIPFWGGIDWMRNITNSLIAGTANFSFLVFAKYLVSVLILVYGLVIVIFGIKARKFIHISGRVRVVTYILVVFTPFIYGVVDYTYIHFLSIILFFPLFYGIVELFDKITPEPKIYSEDLGKGSSEFGGDQSSSMPQMPSELPGLGSFDQPGQSNLPPEMPPGLPPGL